jgi:hypothetical protein
MIKFGHGSMTFGRIMPLLLSKYIMKFSVCVHYLTNSITHSTQIWHIEMLNKCAGQIWIWTRFNGFLCRVKSLSIIWNFQFLIIISPTVLHIQLKFDVCIFQRNEQVKFKFGHGLMIFGRIVSPFTLKIIWNFQFSFIISSRVLHIQLKFEIWIRQKMCRSSLNFVMVRRFLAELCPLTLKKKRNFQFPVIISPTVVHIQLKLKIWICHTNALVSF